MKAMPGRAVTQTDAGEMPARAALHFVDTAGHDACSLHRAGTGDTLASDLGPRGRP